jgi:hypothetical protein
MSDQTTEQSAQSEQPTAVVQDNQSQATAEVQGTVLTGKETIQQTETPKEIDFKSLIPEEYKEEKALSNFNNMEDLLKSYLHAQKMVGANKIAVPNKMATEDDWKEVFKKLGAPEKPDDYKYSFKEDEINPEQLKSFNETAHKLGLLPKQAENLIKFYQEMNSVGEQSKLQTAQAKQLEAESLLKKEFGAEYGKRLDQAKRLASETFGKELLNNTILQDGSRLGDNVEIIRAFTMLADKLSEDEIVKGDDVGYMTAGQIEKEISQLTEEGSAYWNKNHPNHRKAVEEVYKLRQQLNG